jgi:hypothetical protein
MLETFRSFQVTDPFDRQWEVEFRWQQNAISIRHADTVDVKFWLSHGDEKLERVIALQNPDLLALAARAGRSVSDAWCLKLGALHLEHMISTWEDLEKTLVTVPYAELEKYNKALEEAAAAPQY